MVWEGLDADEWCRRLDIPEAEFHDTLDSTNARARAWVRERGAPAMALVVAEVQTTGRGRSGRSWHSPAGAGVWASFVVPARELEWDALLPLRVGMSLASELEALCGAPVGVKWPNDLFLGRRGAHGKVAGILCERVPAREGAGEGPDAWVVVGIGVNVRPVEVAGDYPAAHLGSVVSVARAEVLEALVRAVREALSRRGQRLAPWELNEWGERDILMDRAVQVVAGDAPAARGVARGVDPQGRLRVEGPGGATPVTAGSVRLLEAVRERAGAERQEEKGQD